MSTPILVGAGRHAAGAGRRALPEVLEALEPLDDAFDTPEEPLLV